jgi:SOCE-associated regulatory factor of calcium homoeostasis
MDNAYRFGQIAVSCEGYDYSDDPYILRGSCGVSHLLYYVCHIKFVFCDFYAYKRDVFLASPCQSVDCQEQISMHSIRHVSYDAIDVYLLDEWL